MSDKDLAFLKSLEDQIWFTRKARIRTSERLLSNKFHSNLILVWYSFFSFSLSIYLIKEPKLFGDNADVIMTILTGAVFTLSLFVPQLNLTTRYEDIKKNYILMQGLLFKLKFCKTESQLEKINNRYLRLLHAVENHTNLDLLYFLNYESGSNCTMKISVKDWILLQCYIVIRITLITLIYSAPIVFLVCYL
ncbi:SLATT domain-containing protein [Aliivibrio fischeri]|uniref:SMODS and SLOG-associating 2TM effector domain-containing protein n=1 Tax=Aliivibrio fischeri TaxID=668 RepID=A0A510UN10_ALIFS|nr:SLATT domain-containing protein [Aliivibrio fischeri]GEK14660.1 hypothetical protein AFI02nite_26960 [Aliivibrio fischeri]